MRFLRSRRALLTAALATSALAACGGGGSIKSAFTPARGVLLDGTGNSWAAAVLTRYGGVPGVNVSGGDYSLGSAPVLANNGTQTLAQRVGSAIAVGLVESDLVIVSGGVPDIADPAIDATAAGQAMAAQVRRLVNDGGARRVLVSNAHDVGKSPYAVALGQGALFTSRTRAFNDALKIGIADLGDNVLLFDTEQYVNQAVVSVANTGTSVPGVNNVTAPACTGSTVGTGQVSSSACTTGAFGGNDPALFLFYDPLYLSVVVQTDIGRSASDALRVRW